MAVIRQRQQVFSKPIGVTRMDTGEADLWRTVKAGADELTSVAFKEGARIAEETATKQGNDLALSAITTIDPVTGEPEAFSQVEGQGSIAAAAFRRVVDARYMDNVDNNIRTKAAEYALKYESPAAYEEQMSKYIADVVEQTGVEGKYANIIMDKGTEYLKSTKINLMQKARARYRTDQSDYLLVKAMQDSSRLYDLATQGGDNLTTALFEFNESYGPTTLNGEPSQMQSGADSGLLKGSQLLKYRIAGRTSIAQGFLSYVMEDINNLNVREDFIKYIKTRGQYGAIPRTILEDQSKLNNFKTLFGKHDEGFLGVVTDAKGRQIQVSETGYVDFQNLPDVLQFAKSISGDMTRAEARAQQNINDTKAIVSLQMQNLADLEAISMIESIPVDVSNQFMSALAELQISDPFQDQVVGPYAEANALQSVGQAAINNATTMVQGLQERLLKSTPTDKNPYTSTEYQSDVKEINRATLAALLKQGVLSGGGVDTVAFESMVAGESVNLQGVSVEQQVIAKLITSNPSIYNSEDDVSFAKKYINDIKNDFVDEQIKAQRSLEVSQLYAGATRALDDNPQEDFKIAEALKAALTRAELDGVITTEQKRRDLNKYGTYRAKAYIADAFTAGGAITAQQYAELSLYVKNKSLPNNANRELVRVYGDRILDRLEQGQDPAGISQHLGTISSKMKTSEDIATAKLKTQSMILDANMGTSKAERINTAKASDQQVLSLLGLNVEGDPTGELSSKVIEQVFTSSFSLGDPSQYKIGDDEFNINNAARIIMSEAQRGIMSNGLAQLFNKLASPNHGDLNPQQVENAMSHFANMHYFVHDNGVTSSIIDRDSYSDLYNKSTLDNLSSVYLISQSLGTRQYSEILTAMNKPLTTAQQQLKTQEFGSGAKFIHSDETIKALGLSYEAAPRMAALAEHFYNSGTPVQNIPQLIVSEYETTHPVTDGYVLDYGQTDIGRSRGALIKVIPNPKLREAFIDDVASNLPEGYRFGVNPTVWNEVTSGNVFGVLASAVEESKEAFLIPLPKSNDNAFYWILSEIIYSKDSDGNSIPMGTAPIRNEDTGTVMFFSDNEDYLNNLSAQIKAENTASAQPTADQIEDRKTMRKTGKTVSIQDVDPNFNPSVSQGGFFAATGKGESLDYRKRAEENARKIIEGAK